MSIDRQMWMTSAMRVLRAGGADGALRRTGAGA